MQRRALLAFFLVLPLVAGPEADYLSARRKMEQIESDRLRPGSRVMFSARELNAWIREEARCAFPTGLRDTRIDLGQASATGYAVVDFGKIRRDEGNPPGWLMSKLLDGDRPVEVAVRVRSGGGMAEVDVQSVRISDVTIEGNTLDWLIRYVVLPNYPDAVIGRPFELSHGIERFEVKPGGVDVVLR